jgi:hypothetical protein
VTAAKIRPGTLALVAKCNQTAAVTLNGTVTEVQGKKHKHGKHAPKRVQLKKVNAMLRANVANSLTMRIPASVIVALKHGTKESATFTLSAQNGNGTTRATARSNSLRL